VGGGAESVLMPHTPEKVSSGQPNIQDVFLNYARRERLSVAIQLMSGESLEGRIKNFDRFAVIVEVAGADHMLFKHAIASIRTPRAVANYFTHN
jgi:host factor-I protein